MLFFKLDCPKETGYHLSMRVKKDKCYVVVTKDRGRIQGAFPFTKEGKKKAKAYAKGLPKEKEYEIKAR